MYSILIRLMAFAALVQLGLSHLSLEAPISGSCRMRLEHASRELLQVNWKPISVFPEEGKRFIRQASLGVNPVRRQIYSFKDSTSKTRKPQDRSKTSSQKK